MNKMQLLVLFYAICIITFSGCIYEKEESSKSPSIINEIPTIKMINSSDLIPENVSYFQLITKEKTRKVLLGKELDEFGTAFVPTDRTHNNVKLVIVRSLSYPYEGTVNASSSLGQNNLNEEAGKIADKIGEQLFTYYRNEDSNLDNISQFIGEKDRIITYDIYGYVSEYSTPMWTSSGNITYNKIGTITSNLSMSIIFTQVTVFYSLGRNGNAIKESRETMQRFSKIMEARLMLPSYDEAIELDPNDATAWYNKGIALGWQARYNDAIKAFDKAIEINPQHAEAWYNKGVALEFQGKYEDAVKAYDKAIEINPQHAEAWYNKGNIFKNQTEYNEAINAFDRAIEINPQLAYAWYNKGDILSGQGKYNEAVEAYDKATENNPHHAEAWYKKGIALELLNREIESNVAFSKARMLGYAD